MYPFFQNINMTQPRLKPITIHMQKLNRNSNHMTTQRQIVWLVFIFELAL